MSSEELFSKTITALQNVESDTQRTYLAGQLLGRGATELGALLNTSAEETEQMRQRVHELGGVMSDEAVKASAKFKDSLQDMKTSLSGIKNSLLSEFLPSFTQVMDGLTNIFAGEDGGAEKVSAGIDQILKNIDSATGKLKPVIRKIGGIFVTAVKENAPKLIKEGASILGDLVIGTIKNLPEIISTSGEILSGIGESIVAALPALRETASDVIKGFAGYLKDNLPVLIPKGVETVVEFAKGITSPETLGTLISAAGDIVNGLVTGLTDPKTLDAIIEGAPVIVKNLCDGLVDSAGLLFEAASTLIGNLLIYMSEPENVKKMEECGEDILAAVATGFTNLLGTGVDSIYNLGGQIAKNIGLGDYWGVGDKAMQDFWNGFKKEWAEFKEWFNIEVKNLLNPVSMVKSVKDSIGEKLGDIIDESLHGKKESAFNYDELETLPETPVYGPSPLPSDYKSNHGNLSDRKHASGGIFTRPTYDRFGDVYGEAGRELLLPLDSNTGWIDTLAEKLSKNNAGTIIQGNLVIQMEGESISSDYDTDRFIERVAEKLANLSIMQTRAIGGTGYNG